MHGLHIGNARRWEFLVAGKQDDKKTRLFFFFTSFPCCVQRKTSPLYLASYWHFFSSGDPLIQISKIEHLAPISTVVVSPQVFAIAKSFCTATLLPKSGDGEAVMIVTAIQGEIPIPPPLPLPQQPVPKEVQVRWCKEARTSKEEKEEKRGEKRGKKNKEEARTYVLHC